MPLLSSINDSLWLSLVGKDMVAELDGNGNYLYIGYAIPGSLITDAKWQIQKFFIDPTFNQPTQSRYANGSDEFIYIWDNRGDYYYGGI